METLDSTAASDHDSSLDGRPDFASHLKDVRHQMSELEVCFGHALAALAQDQDTRASGLSLLPAVLSDMELMIQRCTRRYDVDEGMTSEGLYNAKPCKFDKSDVGVTFPPRPCEDDVLGDLKSKHEQLRFEFDALRECLAKPRADIEKLYGLHPRQGASLAARKLNPHAGQFVIVSEEKLSAALHAKGFKALLHRHPCDITANLLQVTGDPGLMRNLAIFTGVPEVAGPTVKLTETCHTIKTHARIVWSLIAEHMIFEVLWSGCWSGTERCLNWEHGIPCAWVNCARIHCSDETLADVRAQMEQLLTPLKMAEAGGIVDESKRSSIVRCLWDLETIGKPTANFDAVHRVLARCATEMGIELLPIVRGKGKTRGRSRSIHGGTV